MLASMVSLISSTCRASAVIALLARSCVGDVSAAPAVPAATSDIHFKNYTALTKPLPLRPGEVTNTYHTLEIPAGPIAVYGFAAEVVEKDEDGNVIPVPIYDAYLHHHVVGSKHHDYASQEGTPSPMKPAGVYKAVGFGAGTEARGTPQRFDFPFAFGTVEGEDEWIANVHVINTRDMNPGDAHSCLECPCTAEDVFLNGTINGIKRPWGCNKQLLSEGNTACAFETYYGGLRCCEDGEFCLEEDELELMETDKTDTVSTYYLQYTLTYADVVPENQILGLASCCDASGDADAGSGNIEYDIAKCDEDPSDCVHTLSTVQRLHGDAGGPFGIYGGEDDGDRPVDVVYMVGHLHRGGIDISLYDDVTGELICESRPTYGTGKEVMNEDGYIVAMSTCAFDPPRRMRTSDPLRVVAHYNSTEAHTGVMSLFYIAIADVPLEEEKKAGGGHMRSLAIVVVIACVALVAVYVFKAKGRRGYEPVKTTQY